jgi:glyoxylase-like metal-dependent hydrolase (beta-lactamase superfamily II)
MRITGSAQHAAWLARATPPIEEVRTGLWSVPVPIPDSPLRYTLSYVFTGDNDVVVVDPGWNSEAGWQALADGLRVAGASTLDVTGIVVTHVHADHHGLSRRLRQESGAWVAMHPAERDSLPSRLWNLEHSADDQNRDEKNQGSNAAWLSRFGVPDEIALEMTASRQTMKPFLDLAEPDVLLEHGDLVPFPDARIRAVWTPGHTPGHLCLYDEPENVLLTGDHVLPRITPNIGLHPHSVAPLATYLTSLSATAAYDGAEALPAHEYRFEELGRRTHDLQEHHRERCREVLGVLAGSGPSTAWQVTERLTWSRGWDAVTGMMRRAALAETAAHLDYLIGRQQVVDTSSGPGEPARYVTTGSERSLNSDPVAAR